MAKELQDRLKHVQAKLDQIYDLNSELKNTTHKIMSEEIKIKQTMQHLQDLRQELDVLSEQNSADDFPESNNAIMIGENIKYLEDIENNLEKWQDHLALLRTAAKIIEDDYFSLLYKDNNLERIESLISLQDPFTNESFEIEELDELVADDPSLTIDDQDLSAQAITKMDLIETQVSQHYAAFESLRNIIQDFSKLVAVDLKKIQYHFEEKHELSESVKALQNNGPGAQDHHYSNKSS